MSFKAPLVSVVVLAVVAFTGVSANPRRHSGNQPGYQQKFYSAPKPVVFEPIPPAPAGYPPIGYAKTYSSSADTGVGPEILHEVYDLLHHILDCLGAHPFLMGHLDVVPELLYSWDTLVRQLLVSPSSVPCSEVIEGVSLDLLESLSEVLTSLLKLVNGKKIGAGEDMGDIPHYVNALVQLLKDIDSSNPGGSGRFGGAGGKGIVLEVLNVLNNLLIEILDSRREDCSSSEYGLAFESFQRNNGYQGNNGQSGHSKHENQGQSKYNGNAGSQRNNGQNGRRRGQSNQGNNRSSGNSGYQRNNGNSNQGSHGNNGYINQGNQGNNGYSNRRNQGHSKQGGNSGYYGNDGYSYEQTGQFERDQENEGNSEFDENSEYESNTEYNGQIQQYGETEYHNNAQYHENTGYHNKTGFITKSQYNTDSEYETESGFDAESDSEREDENDGHIGYSRNY